MDAIIVTRHAETEYNLVHRMNGDPEVPVLLSAKGESQAQMLGLQLAGLPIDLVVHSRLGRTHRTADGGVMGRSIPRLEMSDLDDLYLGELEGGTVEEYRAWKVGKSFTDVIPGGESHAAMAMRYVRGFRSVAQRPEQVILVVTHALAVRYLVNSAHGASMNDPYRDIPNATPFLFTRETFTAAVDALEQHAQAAAHS